MGACLPGWRAEDEEEEGQRVGSSGQGSRGAGSSGSPAGQQDRPTLGIQGASHYVFFDADEEGGSDKKKPRTKSATTPGKAATTTQAKTKAQAKGKGGKKGAEEAQEEDGSGEESD